MAELELVAFDYTGKTLEAPQGADTYVAKKAVKFEQPVTTDSTIDGRQVAVDGTKLDLIDITQSVDLDVIEARVGELVAAVVLMGDWDASTGFFPVSTIAGETWRVTVTGSVGGADFTVGDQVQALINTASGTVYTNNWIKIDNTDLVTSVAGKTGAVVLVAADITDLGDPLDAEALDSLAKLNALVLDATLTDVSETATAAQGVLAATALQPESIDTLAELNAIITDAELIDTNDPRLDADPNSHVRAHSIMEALDHTDVDATYAPLETGSVLAYVETADGGTDQFIAINTFVTAGYGGIGVDSVDVMPDLGAATWEKVEGFDTNLLVPKNVVYSLVNGSLAITREGIWQIYVKVTLSFSSVTSGREIHLRLWNLTQAQPIAGTEFVFFVGRDQDGINLNFTLNTEVPDPDVGNEIQLEIGGGDAFTTVLNLGTVFQCNHISQYKSGLSAGSANFP